MNHTKEVKAWAMIDSSDGWMFPTVILKAHRKPKIGEFLGFPDARSKLWKVIPCTITYELPEELPGKE